MKCPNCGSENCHYITTTDTHNKLFSGTEACCGALLMGPAGLLCGFCGSEVETKTHEYWVCNSCGNKFSQAEAEKMMQAEAKKIKKFLFYKEIQAAMLDGNYNTQLGERIMRGQRVYLEDVFGSGRFFVSNPPFEIEEFEAIKNGLGQVLNEKELVYLVLPYEGLVLADKGLILRNRLCGWPTEFHQYKHYVYIGQTFVATGSEYEAENLCRFLKFIYLKNDNPIIEKYDSFPVLLSTLQALPSEDHHSYIHFSSQPEYAEYVTALKGKAFLRFEQTNPDGYQEYIKACVDGEERKERWLRYVIWALEVGGILFLSKWLFLREVLNGILAALIVIVPIIIWYFVVLIKSDDASKACLPDYVKAIVEEDEKGNLEKTGDINMIQYDHILGE